MVRHLLVSLRLRPIGLALRGGTLSQGEREWLGVCSSPFGRGRAEGPGEGRSRAQCIALIACLLGATLAYGQAGVAMSEEVFKNVKTAIPPMTAF